MESCIIGGHIGKVVFHKDILRIDDRGITRYEHGFSWIHYIHNEEPPFICSHKGIVPLDRNPPGKTLCLEPAQEFGTGRIFYINNGDTAAVVCHIDMVSKGLYDIGESLRGDIAD